MEKNIKVLFATSECSPFVKVGGLADVVGSLPVELNKQGVDARVIIPLYKKVKLKYNDQLQFLGWKMVHMGWRSLYAGLFSLELNGVIFYFIDNEYYFNFDQIYVIMFSISSAIASTREQFLTLWAIS